MRVLFAGSPAVALPALDALLAGPHQVVGVLTRPDAPAGRGRGLRPSAVAAAAADSGLRVLKPPRLADPEALAELVALAPDCAAVVAYGALLRQSALDAVPHGWVNLHFSLLPRWRGAAPVQHALFAGDATTGVTTFRIVRELDAGPVFTSVATDIGARETAGEVLARLAVSGAGVLGATLDDVAAGAEPTAQPTERVTVAPKVTVADAGLDWAADAFEVDRRVRGCTPEPGAWTVFRGQRVKLGPVTPVGPVAPVSVRRTASEPGADVPAGAPLGPGQLVLRTGPTRVEVGTGSGPVTLSTVQPAGRPAIEAGAWARGARLVPGDTFSDGFGDS